MFKWFVLSMVVFSGAVFSAAPLLTCPKGTSLSAFDAKVCERGGVGWVFYENEWLRFLGMRNGVRIVAREVAIDESAVATFSGSLGTPASTSKPMCRIHTVRKPRAPGGGVAKRVSTVTVYVESAEECWRLGRDRNSRLSDADTAYERYEVEFVP